MALLITIVDYYNGPSCYSEPNIKFIREKINQNYNNYAGDTIHADESSLIILNHRTRLDWNFFWSALFHSATPQNHNAKLVLKNPIRKIPGIGESFQKFGSRLED